MNPLLDTLPPEEFDPDLPVSPENCRLVEATKGCTFNVVVDDGNGGMKFLYVPLLVPGEKNNG
jgi:hypothetical protein